MRCCEFAFTQAKSAGGCNRVQCSPLIATNCDCAIELLKESEGESLRVKNADMALDPEEVLVSADASELDLTSAHLHSLEEVPIPETLSVS